VLPTHLKAHQESATQIKNTTYNLSSSAKGNINAENKNLLYKQQ